MASARVMDEAAKAPTQRVLLEMVTLPLDAVRRARREAAFPIETAGAPLASDAAVEIRNAPAGAPVVCTAFPPAMTIGPAT